MIKCIWSFIPKEPFLAFYVDKENVIKKRPVYGFVIVLDEKDNIHFLPIVYQEKGFYLYPEDRGNPNFLGVVPQDMLNDELENHLREQAKNILLFQAQLDRKKRIMEILSQMEKQYENGEVPRAELVAQAAKELNMVGKEVIIEKDIRSLYESGKIYVPKPGYVKIVPRENNPL